MSRKDATCPAKSVMQATRLKAMAGSIFLLSFKTDVMRTLFLLLFFCAAGFINQSFGQVDSVKLAKTEKKIERDRKEVEKLDKKIAREERRLRKSEKKVERRERNRDKQMKRIRKKEQELDKMRRDSIR